MTVRIAIGILAATILYGFVVFLVCFGHDLRPWIYRAVLRRRQP